MFGIVQGFSFLDANNNGLLDSKDARLGGVHVTLVGTTTGANDNTSIHSTATTDATGHFKFTNVPQGDYKLLTAVVPGLTQGQAQTFTDVSITTNGQTFSHNFLYHGGVQSSSLSMRQFLTNSGVTSLPFGTIGTGAAVGDHTPTVGTKFTAVTTTTSSADTVMSMAGNFKDADFTNSEITFHFTNGTTNSTIKLILFDTVAPRTVANFLDYVTSNKYDDSVIHRLAKLASGGLGVLQGGALTVDNTGTQLTDIAVGPKVTNEFKATVSNKAGTIAMAQSGGDVNSATNQWFFNTVNNAAALDSQKFTVFGKVTDAASLAALTALAQTSTKDLTGGAFATAHPTSLVNAFPLTNYSGSSATFPGDATLSNYMRITDISVEKRTEFLSYALVGTNGGGDSQVATASINNEFLDIHPVAAGTTTFTLQAIDRYGATVNTTITVTVTGNHAPVASDGAITTDEDTNKSATLPTTDADAGDTLTYSIVAQPALGTVNLTNPTTGAYTFIPGAAFQNLGAGQTATTTFTFKATDSHGASSLVKTITVTITGVNDAPTANDGTASTDQNTNVSGTLTATDIDTGDTIASFAITTPPPVGSGTVTLDNAATGAYTFHPGSDFVSLAQGTTTQIPFTFTATDSHGATSSNATIIVTITGVNDVPLANSGTLAANPTTPVTGVLGGSDPDAGDSITFSLVSQPDNGGTVTITDANSGAFTFDPGTAFSGLTSGQSATTTFTFKTTDSHGADSAIATITVTVTA